MSAIGGRHLGHLLAVGVACIGVFKLLGRTSAAVRMERVEREDDKAVSRSRATVEAKTAEEIGHPQEIQPSAPALTEAFGDSAAGPCRQPESPPAGSTPFTLVEYYEAELGKARQSLQALKWKKELREERDEHDLIETVMERGGLGLRLLAHCRTSDVTATHLAASTQSHVDSVMPILARLYRLGAVEAQNEVFVCTDKGQELLRKLEAAASVEL